EVDRVETQAEKRSRLSAAGLAMPGNAEFVQIDFEHESLRDGLLRCHVGLDQPTFFSWLGVTMYLEEEAIDAVLRAVAAFPVSSESGLTFTGPPQSGGGRPSSSPLVERVASVGEPFVTAFAPDALEAKLRGAGFSTVEFLSRAEAEARYFRARPADLPV